MLRKVNIIGLFGASVRETNFFFYTLKVVCVTAVFYAREINETIVSIL